MGWATCLNTRRLSASYVLGLVLLHHREQLRESNLISVHTWRSSRTPVSVVQPEAVMTNPKLYANRDQYALSPHFERHMLALTSEHLESKSAIAAELAFRDSELDRLKD